jgi:hypothetical protein
MVEKNYIVTNDRRDHRFLAVYDLDFETLNSIVVDDFTTSAIQISTGKVNAIYEAHQTHDNSNALLIGANRPASELSRATTIAHELAPWWCDYFRIYDRYYIGEDGEADMEAPAYDF